MIAGCNNPYAPLQEQGCSRKLSGDAYFKTISVIVNGHRERARSYRITGDAVGVGVVRRPCELAQVAEAVRSNRVRHPGHAASSEFSLS
jgi:hypothetical protein